MNYKIALIKGDGIGPEIVDEAVKVLDRVGVKYGHTFDYTRVLMGGESIDACGVPLTDEAIAQCKASDSVLMGSIGGNTTTSPWYKLEPSLRPEAGLLKLRKSLGLFANIRPAYLYDELKAACPIKDEIIGDQGFDMVIMRELTGGLGTDIVIETAGTQITTSQAIHIAKKGSTIVLVGYSKTGELTLPVSLALDKELTFKTVFRYRHIYPLAIDAVASGKVNLKGIVTDIFPLDEAQKAMDYSVNNKADIVKAVIQINPDAEA